MKPATEPMRVYSSETVAGSIVESPSEKSELLQSFGSCEQLRSLRVSLAANSRLVCLENYGSVEAEMFRLLGLRLKYLRQRRKLKRIVITSTMPEEGKSVVAANLAATMCRNKKERVLLVEGDLRRPTLSQRFGWDHRAGLTEYLRDDLPAREVIYRVDPHGFYVVTGGETAKDPFELLQSKRLAEFVEQVTKVFDWIIIDSTPILPLADTAVWTRLADGILIVARQGKTEKRPLEKALETLDRSALLGVVLNGFSDVLQDKCSKYYNYYRKLAPSPKNNTGQSITARE